jgi:hypothetical protein
MDYYSESLSNSRRSFGAGGGEKSYTKGVVAEIESFRSFKWVYTK